ncbi:MAG: hypothetical protein ACLPUT_05270 [Solirubrobacteraceae bacterium]|jgi:hypothetical protein
MSDKQPKTQPTQPKGIDPKTGKPYGPIEIPVPEREAVEDALDRLIDATPDE